MKTPKIDALAGILGGGQLAWMLNLSAQKFGVRTRVWDVEPGASGFRSSTQIHCSPWDSEKSAEVFCKGLDLCTLEWESIPPLVLERVERLVPLMPSSQAVQRAASRLLEREEFSQLGFDLSPWQSVTSLSMLEPSTWTAFWERASTTSAYLKHDRGGYDGKGQLLVDKNTPLDQVRDFFELGNGKGIIEARVNLDFEVSVIGARSRSGKVSILGFFENHHENGVLRVSRLVDTQNPRFDVARATQMMISLLEQTQYVGTAALELFVNKTGAILANEWAPRVHNSGHITLDTHEESQFDFHWRALGDLDFPPNPIKQKGLMVNILADDISGAPSFTRAALLGAQDPMPFLARHLSPEELRAARKIVPYDYGKSKLKPGRKMGHLNVLF